MTTLAIALLVVVVLLAVAAFLWGNILQADAPAASTQSSAPVAAPAYGGSQGVAGVRALDAAPSSNGVAGVRALDSAQ